METPATEIGNKLEDQALTRGKIGPQLPPPEEQVKLFFEAAVVISQLPRPDILGSEHFENMKAIRGQLKKQLGKDKANEALYGAADYFSDDEEDLKNCATPKDIVKRSKRIGTQILSNQSKTSKNTEKKEALKKKQDELAMAFRKLLLERKAVKDEISQTENQEIMLEKVHTILGNYKKQDYDCLVNKQKQLTESIKMHEQAIAFRTQQLDSSLDQLYTQKVSESTVLRESDNAMQKIPVNEEQVDSLKKELEKVDSALQQLADKKEEKKSGWFGW